MITRELRKTNEQITTISFFAMLPVLFGGILFVIYLRSTNALGSDTDLVLLGIPIILVCIVLFLGIYEIMYGYRIERKPAYQIKRFLLRSSLSALYLLFVLGLWAALQFYLLPFLYWKYSLLGSFFVATMLLVAAIVRIPKLRDLFTRLEKGI
jgi:hypothetical protein